MPFICALVGPTLVVSQVVDGLAAARYRLYVCAQVTRQTQSEVVPRVLISHEELVTEFLCHHLSTYKRTNNYCLDTFFQVWSFFGRKVPKETIACSAYYSRSKS